MFLIFVIVGALIGGIASTIITDNADNPVAEIAEEIVSDETGGMIDLKGIDAEIAKQIPDRPVKAAAH